MDDERTPENGWTLRVYKYLFESEGVALRPPDDLSDLEARALYAALVQRGTRLKALVERKPQPETPDSSPDQVG